MSTTFYFSGVIQAPRQQVYQAFLEPETIGTCVVSNPLGSQVRVFQPRQGGQFLILSSSQGKASNDISVYHGRFVRLVQDEKMVLLVAFEMPGGRVIGEMNLTITFVGAVSGTQVSLSYENIPIGIRMEQSDINAWQALQKLAVLLE